MANVERLYPGYVIVTAAEAEEDPGNIGHTDPGCKYVRDIQRTQYIPEDTFKGRICRLCNGRALVFSEHRVIGDTFQCRDCGAIKVDGVCEWCERFDAIHNHPRGESVGGDPDTFAPDPMA